MLNIIGEEIYLPSWISIIFIWL